MSDVAGVDQRSEEAFGEVLLARPAPWLAASEHVSHRQLQPDGGHGMPRQRGREALDAGVDGRLGEGVNADPAEDRHAREPSLDDTQSVA